MHLSLRARIVLLLSVTLASLGAYWIIVGAHAQNKKYHEFADDRAVIGVPNALNVLSNLPFVVVGACGLAFMANRRSRRPGVFIHRIERMPFWVYFAGLIMTGLGS